MQRRALWALLVEDRHGVRPWQAGPAELVDVPAVHEQVVADRTGVLVEELDEPDYSPRLAPMCLKSSSCRRWCSFQVSESIVSMISSPSFCTSSLTSRSLFTLGC